VSHPGQMHRFPGWEPGACILCGKLPPKDLREVPHPMRGPIRPVERAGAYGRPRVDFDVKARVAGDE
jgi:hypothetical protein